jgi:hypothetical protein
MDDARRLDGEDEDERGEYDGEDDESRLPPGLQLPLAPVIRSITGREPSSATRWR